MNHLRPSLARPASRKLLLLALLLVAALGLAGSSPMRANDEIGPYVCGDCLQLDPCTNQPVLMRVCCIAGETLFCNPQFNGSGCLVGYSPYCAISSEG